MTKMAARPILYMVKTFQKSSSPEPVGRFPRNLVCSIGDSSPSKFAQMMTIGWEKAKTIDILETIAA